MKFGVSFKDYPLLNTQWFMLKPELNENRDASLNVATGLRIRGKLDYSKVENAIQKLVDYNEIFRTVCVNNNGEYMQRVFDEAKYDLIFVDANGETDEERTNSAMESAWKFVKTPMDLFNDSMLHFSVHKISEEDHILLFVIHHLILDGKGYVDIVQQFFKYYANGNAGKEEGTATFLEFMLDENAYLESEAGQKEIAYWEKELEGYKPIDLPEPKVKEAFNSAEVGTCIFDKIALDEFVEDKNTSVFNVMITAYHIALTKVYGVSDTMIGFSGANRLKKKYINTIGYLSRAVQNRLVVNDDDVVGALLDANIKKVSENVGKQRSAHLNQNDDSQFFITIPNYIAKKRADREKATSDTVSTTTDYITKGLQAIGMSVEMLDFSIPRKLDYLTLFVIEKGENAVAMMLGDTEIYDREHITAIRDAFYKAVQAIITTPELTVGEVFK